MNRKMIRDISILIIIAIAALVAYRLYSSGGGVKDENIPPSSPPPPRGNMQAERENMDREQMKAHILFQRKEKAFEQLMEKITKEAKIEKFKDYNKRGVVAIVNGEKIPTKEFKRRLQSVKSMMGADNPAVWTAEKKKFEANLIEKMIKEALIRQEAARRGIVLADEEIQGALESRKTGFGSDEKFREALKAHNFTEKDIRDQLAREMLLAKLMEDVSRNVSVPDEEIDELIRSQRVGEGTR